MQPLQEELKLFLEHLRHLSRTMKQALAEKSALQDLHAVSAAIEDVELKRVVLQKMLRDVRLQNRARLQHDDDAAYACAFPMPTADDAYRALGVLIAVGRFTDKLVLFAKDLARDPWLKKRGLRRWLHRNAVYL
ncbi:hypothetical protein WJX74_002137 [Apatococcus lobatus]|uniref:Uncharacterized protein n=1 Tax=Apatococcus lobatus TaxID=904363 RepID=A0AAW1RLR3_9CHLO